MIGSWLRRLVRDDLRCPVCGQRSPRRGEAWERLESSFGMATEFPRYRCRPCGSIVYVNYSGSVGVESRREGGPGA